MKNWIKNHLVIYTFLLAIFSPLSVVSPVEVIEGFGIYARYRIQEQDVYNAAHPYNGPTVFDKHEKYNADEILELRKIVDEWDKDHTQLGTDKLAP